ncbi:hypothetical protein ACSU1N_03805 [Thermogladius sp. 4427co]|uniref:hypothetical protein n=1 Tax=Thermogladius sp. 4427co TaxID=3450718 RepID=UPI003F7B193F
MSSIMKAFVYGVYLAVETPVKPGGYHRLRIDPDAGGLVCNSIAVSDHVLEAFSLGERVRRGELSLPSLELGKALNKAMREAFRWCGRVFPSIIAPGLVYSIALGYTGVESILRDHGQVKRFIENLLRTSRPGDVKQFTDALKSVRRDDMLDHLTSTDVAGISLLGPGVSFSEVFRVLSSKWPAFTLLDTQEFQAPGLVRKMLEYKKKYGSVEAGIIGVYLDLVQPKLPSKAREELRNIAEPNPANREVLKKLLEIDLELRKQGFTYNEYVEELAVVTFLSIYEGLLSA